MSRAEIIAIGSELLLGGRPETNSIFLAEWLAKRGIEVRVKTVVGDHIDDVCDVVTQAAERAKIVFVTGGLGPTVDDVTREAMAQVTRKPLRLRTQALKWIEARLKSAGRIVSENQRRQAFLPVGSRLLHNSAGTAQGFYVKWNQCGIFCLPGVSHEARGMLAESVPPILEQERWLGVPAEIRTIHTFGLSEGDVDHRIQGIIPSGGSIRLNLLASSLGVSVSLTLLPGKKPNKCTAGDDDSRNTQPSLDDAADTIKGILGHHVFAVNGRSMEEVVGQSLQAKGFILALAESCTGGLIGHRLTETPGSSTYVDRGIACYSNQAKMDLLGVPESILKKHGAVSRAVAKAMAQGVRTRSLVDVGLSVTGIAGPGGGTRQKPVGLVYVGLSTRQQCVTKAFRFHGNRKTIKLRASQAALDVLRRWLDNLPLDEG